MGVGLSLDRPLSWKAWRTTWRLLVIGMPLFIAAVALLAWGCMGLLPASALLLAAVLAPTDPVLAGDVQVGGPNSGEEDEVRFGLTSEAGLNDGLGFPFVYLALFVGASAGVEEGTRGCAGSPGSSSARSPSGWPSVPPRVAAGPGRVPRARPPSRFAQAGEAVARARCGPARLRRGRDAAGLRLPRRVRRRGGHPHPRARHEYHEVLHSFIARSSRSSPWCCCCCSASRAPAACSTTSPGRGGRRAGRGPRGPPVVGLAVARLLLPAPAPGASAASPSSACAGSARSTTWPTRPTARSPRRASCGPRSGSRYWCPSWSTGSPRTPVMHYLERERERAADGPEQAPAR